VGESRQDRPLIATLQSWVRDAWAGALRPLRARHAATISTGLGKGLRFSSGSSNPHYEIGDNEIPVQDVLAKYVLPGGVFLDVGANVGFMTVIGARLVGPQGRVYAFEPVSANANLIRRNAAQNNFTNVFVIEQAASNATGSGRLIMAAYSGGSALAIADRPHDAVGERVVPTLRIDDAIAQGLIGVPTFAKIDVEGAESQVLEGMIRTLERDRPTVLFEVDGAEAGTVRGKADVCCGILEGCGYAVTRLYGSYPGIRWHVEHYLAIPNR
jgi:FkbM family methyltransferase